METGVQFPPRLLVYGGIAQLGERGVCNAEVVGSSPSTSTMFEFFRWVFSKKSKGLHIVLKRELEEAASHKNDRAHSSGEERYLHTVEVVGSNPTVPTCRDCKTYEGARRYE